MDSWGFNPSTLQAIGGIGTAFALFGVIVGSAAAIWSSKVSSRDSSFRTRPWVGLTYMEFIEDVPIEDVDANDLDESDGAEYRTDVIILSFSNVGTVPAQKRTIEFRLKPEKASHWEMRPFGSKIGALFPNEPSIRRYRFTRERATILDTWKSSNVEVIYEGVIRYSFGKNNDYFTRFSGKLGIGPNSRKSWRNDEAA